MESKAPPQPGHLPQGISASRSPPPPQNQRHFPKPILRFQKFQFQSSLPSPAPRRPAIRKPQSGLRRGNEQEGRGAPAPVFLPDPAAATAAWKSWSPFSMANKPRWRDTGRHLLEQFGLESTHLGTRVRHLDSPAFSMSSGTVAHCFQPLPCQLGPYI
jgi:hypothetical protein